MPSHNSFAMLVRSLWLLFLLSLGCLGEQPEPGSRALQIRSHPFGTLLQDANRDFWRVSEWPGRNPIAADTPPQQLDPRSAVSMTEEETACLRQQEQSYFDGRDPGWYLARFSDALWYVHEEWRRLRTVDPIVMAAWHEDESQARDLSSRALELETWPVECRMPLPPGTLIQTERYLFYVDRLEELRPFTSESLARAAGYHPELAMRLSIREALPYGWLGRWLTVEVFARCPTEETNPPPSPSLSMARDEDMDMVSALWDCDDTDSTRSPFREERCDGIDNDCDGLVDEECRNP